MNTYQAGGSLDARHPFYIRRQADLELYESLLAGTFCSVLNARQMGKSSLMVQAMSRLQEARIHSATIDMSRICGEGVTSEQFYKGMAIELWRGLGLLTAVPLLEDWKGWDGLPPAQKWGLTVERLLKALLDSTSGDTTIRLVVLVDEVDSLLHMSFPVYDFFASLRSFYNLRSLNPLYTHLTFAMFGTASPTDLMGDRQTSPFNIGTSISLQGFRLTEAKHLAKGLKGHARNPLEALREILYWTGGQPFLTQRVCQLVVEQPFEPTRDERSDRQRVADIVRTQLIENWELQDVPEHLRTIRNRLTYNPSTSSRLLGLYRDVLQVERTSQENRGAETRERSDIASYANGVSHPPDHKSGDSQPLSGLLGVASGDSAVVQELLLSGLVSTEGGRLRVKNPIYRTVFDEQWVEQQLAELRPYGTAFEQWCRAKDNPSYLLRGEELETALAWAAQRRLSDDDYRYLSASQDLAQQQTAASLEALERASRLLADSRQQARSDSDRPAWRWSGAIALGVALPTVVLRLAGLLQGLEWHALDVMFRWRPQESLDARVAIVTVDEQDIEAIGQWPIPDAYLADAIMALKSHGPRAIGLDFYRHMPVNPGHDRLLDVFRTTPELVGIEKVIGDRLPPATELAERGQVGFSDLVLDDDGRVRRALLSVRLYEDEGQSEKGAQTQMPSGAGEIHHSFAVRLALNYLTMENTAIAPVEGNAERLQVGRQVFERFERNDGGYVGADAGGFQVLLNYRGNAATFDTLSLRQVLEGEIPDAFARDRVVLIGQTSQSTSDWFLTPYSSRWFGFPERISPGIAVHANIVSQILAAALDGRALLRVWPTSVEVVWIVAWAVVGSALAQSLRATPRLALMLLVSQSGLMAVCLMAFGLGWWIPLVPPMLSGCLAAGVTAIVLEHRRDTQIFNRTLERLTGAYQQDPLVGRIALEYLRQSETPARKMVVERRVDSVSQADSTPLGVGLSEPDTVANRTTRDEAKTDSSDAEVSNPDSEDSLVSLRGEGRADRT